MKREQMLDLFITLSKSQGSYGRLLEDIYNMSEEEQENYWKFLEAENFKEPYELIMFIEGV